MMFHGPSWRWVPVVTLLVIGMPTRAQTTDMARLHEDLCGCVSAIDPRSADAVVDRSVSNCLETAVLEHPYAVRELLHAGPNTGTPGYRIGQMLGGLLSRDCEAFRALRVRLNDMHRPAVLKKGAT
ncbi:MAG: hypothetical protein H6595_01645 [Flavobacteriales bacterium]|nr:hypothetical protein [Flavobacteriales bacterium]MCB9166164.1 hypothetical protein [Flavobacteriales bacterium]